MSQLLSALPVGSLVKEPNYTYLDTVPVFRILEHGHSGDPSGSTTLEFRDIVCDRCFDAKEPNNTNSDRKTSGNNRYRYSNILQWLNSTSSAGNWYSAKHSADAPPIAENVYANPYKQEAGFLWHMPSGLRSALLTVSKPTHLLQIDGGGDSSHIENVESKVFLLSAMEVMLSASGGNNEGSSYNYYQNHYLDRYRIKTMINPSGKGSLPAANEYWWLRTPVNGKTKNAGAVGTDGKFADGGTCYYPQGVSPAFCISSDTKVSDAPDSNGVYSLIFNATPTISPASTNYGNVSTPPSITCTLADSDGDSFTYTVKLNGTTKDSGSGTASKTFALDMTSYWSQMALGTNTIVVQATDSQGATASATYTMNKTNSAAPVPTTDLVNNSRKDTSFYIGFQIGQDADGDSQTVVAQVSDSSDMSDPTEFTSVEKLVAGAWIPVQTLTNADAGASLRIQVTGQTVGDTIYVRLKDTDSGSGSPVYTSVYAISIGSTLEFDTLPITRTTKPSIVVAYLDKTMPADATLQMYACNNANDATPTWEPITEGESHQFTNKTKTATNWGVSVKTNIAAGATAGEISVSAVGLGVL